MKKVINWSWAFTICASAVAFSTGVAEAQWGTLKGQVIFDGPAQTLKPLVTKGDPAVRDAAVCSAEEVPNESLVVDAESKGIANVMVWLSKKPEKIHPDLAKSKDAEVVFDQKGCKFFPHALIVRTDQKVLVKSDDGVSHNTHTWPVKNKAENTIISANDRVGVGFPLLKQEERLPFKVSCDIHSWMEAWWMVVDHPYYAVTNAKGEFEIANVPVGALEFKVWQERAGYVDKSLKVTVKDGENKLPVIKAAPALFEKK